MKIETFFRVGAVLLLGGCASAGHHEAATHGDVPDTVVAEQRAQLARNTEGKGFGPQSPRDIDQRGGENPVSFSLAPMSARMNLCNIHFHKNAEHKGRAFSDYAGNGDGHGYGSGYRYSGRLSTAELAPVEAEVCPSAHGSLSPGDTIEVHYVFSTAQVQPGPTLGACLSDAIKNPQLLVEGQVFVLVNDRSALDFGKLAAVSERAGFAQAPNMTLNTGRPVEYAGSTTGPGYNEQGSPFQVTWRVRPRVAKVDIATVGAWCKGNVFNEDHAHGVRNLVTNPALLSPMGR